MADQVFANGALAGKAALVTGGSRGIGRAISVALAAAGARVGVNYVAGSEAAEETVAIIRAAGGTAEPIKADVSSVEGADAAIQSTIGAFGKLDVLVNNAGINRDNLTMRMSEADWDAVLDTNLKGAFLCSKAAMRPMLRQKGGRIINISSVVGITGNAGQANYAAAKSGLHGLSKALAREVGSRGITVNAVAPGFIDVGMTAGLTQAQRDAVIERIPLARFGAGEDVANIVVFLASDAASYITGTVIPVDGGLAMA